MSDSVSEEYAAKMQGLAKAIDHFLNGDELPKKVCFTLLLAQFGDGEEHTANYISNGDRADVMAMMREMLEYLECQNRPKPCSQTLN